MPRARRGAVSPPASRPASPADPTGAGTPRRPQFFDRLRRCAVVPLLALAALAAPLTTAHAETVIWSATLTVGRLQSSDVWGYSANDGYGTLDDTDFTIGSTTYTVPALRNIQRTPPNRVVLTLDIALGNDDIQTLVLWIGSSSSFKLSEATVTTSATGNTKYQWNVSLSLTTVNENVAVKLTDTSEGTVATDRAALVALYNATDGANWTDNTNWLSNAALSQWHGVTTDVNGRVTRLILSENELDGAIPAELGNLANLEYLFLGDNTLDGEIPPELGNLANLIILSLGGNELDGGIPAELGNLANLDHLFLDGNELSGAIPAELGDLANLQSLFLDGNELSGGIPAELRNLTNLLYLYLGDNELTGGIPAELGNLANLDHLFLDGNELSGAIPAELGDLANLQSLFLDGNELSGGIPAALGDLTELRELSLSRNMLDGEIPAALGDLASLQSLYLDGNELTGAIPAELGNLANLIILSLGGNELSGEIPPELGNLANLIILSLGGNELSGEIPAELGGLTNLQVLYLWGNALDGEIPEELGDLTSLWRLYLNGNELSGGIPAELGNLTELRELTLSRNMLDGEIPAALGDLASLQELYLHSNELSGEIPSWLVNLTGLLELSLWSNQLTGTIPPEVAPAQDRAVLRVLYNATGGANWTNNTNWLTNEALSEWYGVATNSDGRVSGLALNRNQLTGPIPAELGNLSSLQKLYLHSNELTGPIPEELGDLTNLGDLYLHSNELTGPIPAELGNLASLQELILQKNMLDGEIPAALGDLTRLQRLYLNQNELSGPLPLTLSALSQLSVLDIRETTLCAPVDTAFQAWLATINFQGTVCATRPGGGGGGGGAPDDSTPGANNFPTADAGPDQSGVWEGALVTLDGSGSSHPEDDPLRYRWNQLSGQPVVLSSQNIVNPTFTAPEGLTAEAALRFRLLVTDPEGRFDSDTVTVTVDPEAEPPLAIYYFPHLAVGAGWQTTITYINYSSEEVTCQTDFLSDQGTPLLVSFADQGTVVSRPDVLQPGESVHQETNVVLSAPLAPGWARATCSGPLKASLLFRRHDSAGLPVAEAGVNATAVAATRFVTFAEQGEGRFGTGVAYANPSDTAALVTFTARDADGETLASDNLMLSPNGHGAQNMVDLFDLSSFTGSLEVTSTQPIVSLSLNNEADPIFSSLPPGEVDAAAQGATTYYFPHLAVGAGWQTTLTYINYSSQQVTCQTEFLSDFGSPLMVSFAGMGTVISRSDVLPPGGSLHQETNVGLSAPLAPGWARAACSGPLKASLLYRRRNSEGMPTGEAGVNAATVPATRFVTFAEQGEGKYGTGVAYANPSATTTAFVTFTAKDADGETLASVVRTLLPNGHDAKNMVDLFGLSSFSGSLEVTSTAPIVSLSLNNEADPVFSSLPPGEVNAAAQ